MADSAAAAKDPSLEDADVVTKYKTASEMANAVLADVMKACVAGASVRELCANGDAAILAAVGKAYNKKVDGKVPSKGVGFPTCVSVNNIVAHYSPLSSDPDTELKDGDVCKVDLGVHIDGYAAVVAGTTVVGASKEAPVTGRKADVILAAYNACELALRMVRPGNGSKPITEAIGKVCSDFDCRPVEGMVSHNIMRYKIDGDKQIIQNPSEAHRKDHKECTFEVNEVYGIDCIATTGDGKARQSEIRTTVYKKTDEKYLLKMKASRQFFGEVSSKFTTMPFSLRACEDEIRARTGVRECVTHKLLVPFDVLHDREEEITAQFKVTALVMANGNLRTTFSPFDAEMFKSEHSVQDEEHQKLLRQQITNKTKKKKKKKAAKKEGEAAAAATTESEEKKE